MPAASCRGRLGRKGSYQSKGSQGRSEGTVPAPLPFYCLSRRELRRTNRCSTPSPTPENMLRPSVRLIDSFASAKTLPAASGRLCRRGRSASVVQAPGVCIDAGSRFLRAKRIRSTDSLRRRSQSLFVIPFRTAFPFFPIFLPVWPTAKCRKRDAVLFCLGHSGTSCWFHPLFILAFSTAFPSFLPYTTPAITGGEQEQDAVFRMFRKCGLRFGGSHYHSGNGAALIGFREGGRAGNPMPQLSPCINILPSDRYDGIARGYITI